MYLIRFSVKFLSEKLSCIKIILDELCEAISPYGSVKVPIYFQPMEEIIYDYSLEFSVIGFTEVEEIRVKGEGVPYKV